MPHGKHVHAAGLGQLFVGVFLQIINGDGQIPAAAIALPGAIFLGTFDVGDFGAIGGEAGQIAAGNGQDFCRAALRGDQIKARVAVGRRDGAVGTKQNIFAVGRPPKNDVGGRMEGEALGLAAFCGDDVDVGIAVVFSGEGDPFAVGRKFRVELVAGTGGQAAGGATVAGSGPEIAGVGEDYFVLGNVGVTEEARGSRGRLVCGRGVPT